MGVAYNPKIVTDGLVLALDAANPKSYPGTGTTFINLTGNGVNGTLINSVIPTTEFGGGLTADGISGYIDYGNDASMQVTPASSFTIITIFKMLSNVYRPTLTNGASPIFGRGSTSGSHGIGWQSIDGAHILQIGLRATDNISVVITPSVNLNQVYYVAMSYSPTRLNIFLDKEKVADNLSTTSLVGKTLDNEPWRSFSFNAVTGGNSAYANGRLYYASFYNRALSDSEIQNNFNALHGRYGI